MKLKGHLMYSGAYLAIALTTQTVVTWHAYFYAPPEKDGFVNVALVGYALLLGRIVDAVADPLIAFWSDNSTNKKGRRIPFIKYGALPLVLSFILVWFPVVNGVCMLNFYYLVIIMSAFFFFFTVVVAPYLALLPELTPDPDERVTISTYQSIFNIVGLLLSSIGAGILIERFGYKVMGLILGAISLVFFYLPVLTVREKPYRRRENDLSFWESFYQLFQNRNYLFYQIANLLLWFGINMLTIAVPYIGSVLLGVSEQGSGLLLGGTFIVAIAASPLILKVTHIYGKKKVFSLSILLFALDLALVFFIGRPWLFFDQLWYGFLIVALAGIPVSAIFIIPNAIIADITDEDAAKTGQRREAMFFGVQGLISKMIMGVSSWVTLSILFHYFGYSLEHPTGIYLTSPLAVIFSIIGYFVFVKGYNLDEEKVIAYREIKTGSKNL
ncbi:MAG: glycoside/pentoside/hexuronide:cation symporter, family [Halanaerobiales bacterium]|nr:glycoside/pentoside/hexuronide:cation symporter, family [Halanaerobiales bacterium]